MKRTAVALVVLAAASSWVLTARAELAAVRLDYARGPGAETCPDEAALRAAVASRLAYDPFRETAATTVATSMQARRKELLARIELRDAKGAVIGARELVSPESDCSELARAVALAIAIAIDPVSVIRVPLPPVRTPSVAPVVSERTNEPPPGPAISPLPPAAPPSARSEASLPAHAAASAGPHVRATSALLLGAGPTPGLSAGARLGLGVRWPSVSIDLEGRGIWPTSASAAQLPGDVRAFAVLASVVPCLHEGPLLACGVASAGPLRGAGEGAIAARTATTMFAAAGGRAGAEIPLGRSLALGLSIEADISLTPTSLRLGALEVFHTPPVFGALAAGVVGDFP